MENVKSTIQYNFASNNIFPSHLLVLKYYRAKQSSPQGVMEICSLVVKPRPRFALSRRVTALEKLAAAYPRRWCLKNRDPVAETSFLQ